jgi:hypothetical protein
MKYICLGYIEPGKLEGMPEDERHAITHPTRASAFSYESRAPASLPSLRRKSARAECARTAQWPSPGWDFRRG